MIEDNAVLTVRLTAAEWNIVIAHLAEGRFSAVAPLIGKVRDQCIAGANASANGGAAGAEEFEAIDHAPH